MTIVLLVECIMGLVNYILYLLWFGQQDYLFSDRQEFIEFKPYRKINHFEIWCPPLNILAFLSLILLIITHGIAYFSDAMYQTLIRTELKRFEQETRKHHGI